MIVAVGLIGFDQVQGQATVLGNGGGLGDYAGWDGGTPIPLDIRHNGNEPIDFYTDSIQRMRLAPTLTGQNWGWYSTGTLNFSGHLGIGFPTPQQPLTYLHLNRSALAAITVGYRPWMRVGVLSTEGTDGMYAGMRRLNGTTDAVVNWSDDDGASAAQDHISFVFTSTPDSSSVASTYRGLEIARMLPATSGNEGFLGVGDWQTAGVQPTERLDVLNGQVRVRDLPTDPTSTSTEFVTVDVTTGILEHRPMTSLPDNCEWTMNASAPNHVSTAFGTADPSCPDAGDAVGIGYNLGSTAPLGKLAVYSSTYDIATNVDLSKATTETRGVNVRAAGGTAYNYGLAAEVHGTTTRSRGVYGVSSGATYYGIGGLFVSSDDAAYTTGAQGHVKNGVESGFGLLGTCESNARLNIGARGHVFSSGEGVQFIGVQGWSDVEPESGQVNFGVYGRAKVMPDSWAMYAEGEQFSTTSSMWTTVSDETLKTDIEPLEDALDQLLLLEPKRYRFRTEEFPHMQLSEGLQFGVLAQDLAEVFPHMVSDVLFPAVHDSTGAEVHAARTVKAVSLDGMLPLLIAGLKEQHALVVAQAAALDELRNSMDEMQDALAACCANPDRSNTQSANNTGTLKNEGPGREKLHIQPNPFNERTTVYYALDNGGRAQLMANSADGKELRVLHEANLEKGNYQYEWNTAGMAAGIYYVTLLVDGVPMVKKAVKVDR